MDLKVGARVSEYDETAIPLQARDGGPKWKGARVYGTITGIKDGIVTIMWDDTDWWSLDELDHPISEIGDNIRIEAENK